MSHAARTSSVSSELEQLPRVRSGEAPESCESYAVPSASAFSKIVGFDVMPVSESRSMRRASSPLRSSRAIDEVEPDGLAGIVKLL